MNNTDKNVFEKYNNKLKNVECEEDMLKIRDLLNKYAISFVNLSGVISVKEMVDIFNGQNPDQVTVNQIKSLLQPFVFSEKKYCFFKENIVHFWFADDFDLVDDIIYQQKKKKRFIPNREELMKYIDPTYNDESIKQYFVKFSHFVDNELNLGYKYSEFTSDLRKSIQLSGGINNLMHVVETHNIHFIDEDQLHHFFMLVSDLNNNMRMWANKGYTPNELVDEIVKDETETIIFKNQLSKIEHELFSDIMFDLVMYVNSVEKAIPTDEIFDAYDNMSYEKSMKLRKLLWDNPEYIKAYINDCDLPEFYENILVSWLEKHIKGSFILHEYLYEYAVLSSFDSESEDVKFYGVKGLNASIEEMLDGEFPIVIDTVLLPFGNYIIFDGFITSVSAIENQEIAKEINEFYKEIHVITTNLND